MISAVADRPYIYADHLETPRLTTRFLTKDDIRIWTDFFKDKDTVEFFPNYGYPTNKARSKSWIEKQLLRYKEQRFGLQALIDKKTNELIGQCGLLIQDIDGKTELEVGYHIFKKYWGQGYAPEAAKLFIDYAFSNNLADSVTAIIDQRNSKSQRVADKIGMKRERETKWSGLDVYLYRLYKED